VRRLAKIGSGTKATFAPNSEIWACKKADTAKKTWFYGGFLWGSCQGSCTIIESSPRDWLGWSFWRLWGVSGALHENWFGTTATFGLGQNLLIQALWERFWRYKKKKVSIELAHATTIPARLSLGHWAPTAPELRRTISQSQCRAGARKLSVRFPALFASPHWAHQDRTSCHHSRHAGARGSNHTDALLLEVLHERQPCGHRHELLAYRGHCVGVPRRNRGDLPVGFSRIIVSDNYKGTEYVTAVASLI
jgi:hypothetical protein